MAGVREAAGAGEGVSAGAAVSVTEAAGADGSGVRVVMDEVGLQAVKQIVSKANNRVEGVRIRTIIKRKRGGNVMTAALSKPFAARFYAYAPYYYHFSRWRYSAAGFRPRFKEGEGTSCAR